MNAMEFVSIAVVFGLLIWVASQDVEIQPILDKHNESLFERLSPKYDDNGIQKSFIERLIEAVLVGPSRLFPKAPWVGIILVFGGVFILLKKWELIWSKIKRQSLFGKR